MANVIRCKRPESVLESQSSEKFRWMNYEEIEGFCRACDTHIEAGSELCAVGIRRAGWLSTLRRSARDRERLAAACCSIRIATKISDRAANSCRLPDRVAEPFDCSLGTRRWGARGVMLALRSTNGT